jgi:signal transduction histidine kinase
MAPTAARAVTATATATVLAYVALAAATGSPSEVLAGLVCLVPVSVGWVVVHHQPGSPVGPALAWTSGTIAAVALVEAVAATEGTADELPGAAIADVVAVGLWPVNVAGLLALLLVFPDGPRRRWPWRAVPWLFAAGAASMLVALRGAQVVDGVVVGEPAGTAPGLAGVVGIALVALCLVLGIASVVARYRAGEERRRLQIRWLALAGVFVGATLAAGWVAEGLGASVAAAYTPHLVAIVLLVPAAVAVAMVRHDLFDVDRLLSGTLAWLLTLAASAAVFGATVLVLSRALGAGTDLGPAAAAFVTAFALLPLHRHLAGVVGRVVDRDRHVAVASVTAFAGEVRAGRRQPEEIEEVLRAAQRDPDLTVALAAPGGRWVDLRGREVTRPEGFTVQAGGEAIARITLGWESARARRRIADLSVAAWVPLEVSRLRLELRAALADVEASRARLAQAAAEERERLERELHDGAQQRIVATGIRLRRLQRGLDETRAAEVDGAVADLEETVRELRRLAHGFRPARLADGLGPALEELRSGSPVPVALELGSLPDLDEARALTAYLVVSEAMANAFKHAAAERIVVAVTADGARLTIEVRDDGIGGVPVGGLTGLNDRVASVGGELSVDSPLGRGTTVRAVV